MAAGSEVLLRRLDAPVDPGRAWRALGGEPSRVALESLGKGPGTGRWSILAARPSARIVWERERVVLVRGEDREEFSGEPFAALRAALKAAAPSGAARVDGVPFAGGAIGFLAYELGRRMEPGKFPGAREDVDPPLWFGVYGAAIVIERETGGSWIAGTGTAFEPAEIAVERLEAALRAGDIAAVPAMPDPAGDAADSADSAPGYREGVARIRELIAAGDLYQANLSARFSAATGATVDALWERLRSTSPEPFAACLATDGSTVLSASMERLLEVRGRDVETRPIKGTLPRGATPEADAAARAALESSEKDRAELLMIVDLHRNDLGKVCVPGSVTVPTLYGVRTFAHVHHLEATVRGRLRDGVDAFDALRAVFPAGSITGAPKIRAMQVIEALEPTARGVYCGAIGHLGFGGGADFAVAIRTAVLRDGVLRWSAGGGIVWDSDPASEWQEVLAKSRGLRALAG